MKAVMCLSIPGKIVKIDGETATVDYESEQREAKIIKDTIPVKKGDYVLVQAGCVVQKIDKKSAIESLKAWKSISH